MIVVPETIRRGPDLLPCPPALPPAELVTQYWGYLEAKIEVQPCEGIDVPLDRLHPALRTRPFEHQGAITQWALKGGRRLIAASFGLGKCHGLGTKILMHDGAIKNVEDIQVGDQLMGDDGTPRNVLSLARGREMMYRITLKNGDNYTCNESHILSLKNRQGDVDNIYLPLYLALPAHVKNRLKHYKAAIDFGAQPVPADPYWYGVQLAADKDRKPDIDSRYLKNSREIRLQLLAGLLDAGGYLVDGCYKVATRAGLHNDILFLCRSLGFPVRHAFELINGVTYDCVYIGGHTHLIPCREMVSKRRRIKNPLVYGFTVEALGEGDYYGFEIDGNHLYLLGDFTVTHNTTMQAELMRQVHLATGRPTLIIGELNVKYQFQQEDGPRLGMDIVYVRNDEEVAGCASPYMYTNYERVRDGAISPETLRRFVAVSLDEASVLADYASKTFQTFCELFRDTPYKFAATATPARNKYKELLHLTKYFKRNSTKAHELTLKESMEQEFWLWVSSWALFIERPFDLGYPDDGYTMPELDIQWVCLPTDHLAAQKETDGWGQYFLIANAAVGVTPAAREKRRSMETRLAKVKEIVDAHPGEHFILWHNLEDERRAINKLFPDCMDVYGSQEIEEKEERLMAFSRGQFRILSTKPSIAGRGCNFQHHCHNMIFCGIGYSFEEIIQALHRLYRFMQKKPVRVWFLFTEAEQDIVNAVLKKWRQHDELVKNTTAIIRKYGLANEAMRAELRRTMINRRQEIKGQHFTAIHNDSCIELATFGDNSIDMYCTSIPFGTQYEYVPKEGSLNDLGYNEDNAAFWRQMDYLIPHLYRTLKPGRVAAIHVKDRIVFGNVTGLGFPEVEPFSDDCVYAFRKHGFRLLARVTIANDVVRENNQTYRLTYSEMCKDGTKMGAGTNEYWLLFRKPQTDKSKAYADMPVMHQKPSLAYVCTECGCELESLQSVEMTPVDEWPADEGEDAVDKTVCPQCRSVDSFVRQETGGYPLYHWQIDADGLQCSNGNRLLLPDELDDYIGLLTPEQLAEMEIGQVYRWWRAYRRKHRYDRNIHRELGRELARLNRLPKTFSLFSPAVPDHLADTILSVHDYSRMHVLNGQQAQRRLENHICPLPTDLIEWAIERFTNPGEIVCDMFGGIGSVPYQAIKMGRKGIMIELNEAYWATAVKYCQDIELQRSAPTLFDLMELEAA
jgi:DNA modification methylase